MRLFRVSGRLRVLFHSTREGENENFQVGRNGLKIRDPTGLRVGVCRSVIRFV